MVWGRPCGRKGVAAPAGAQAPATAVGGGAGATSKGTMKERVGWEDEGRERESIPFHPLLTSPIPTHPLLLCTGRSPLALISDGSDHSGQGQETPFKYEVCARGYHASA